MSAAEGSNRKSWLDVSDPLWPNLVAGWGAVRRERDAPDRPYRWVGPRAAVRLWNHCGPGVLQLEVRGRRAGEATRFEVVLNAGAVRSCQVEGQGWKIVEVPYEGAAGPLEIELRTGISGSAVRGTGEGWLGVRHLRFVGRRGPAPADLSASVIVTTFNRSRILSQVLEALERQTLPQDRFEVVVVDDGSTDDSAAVLQSFAGRTPLSVICVRQPNRGPAAARNHGMRVASKALLVFLGDDIIPSTEFLERHVRAHGDLSGRAEVAIVGLTRWAPRIRVTPFMAYIGEQGPQFGYAGFDPTWPQPFTAFYTSNLSFHKDLPGRLLGRSEPFDEEFTHAAWEDTELAYRLERMGMQLVYEPGAVAYHDHPTTLRSFCQRQQIAGKASRVFLRKHPELETMLGNEEAMQRRSRWAPWLVGLEQAADFVDRRIGLALPPVLYRNLLKSRYAQGVATR